MQILVACSRGKKYRVGMSKTNIGVVVGMIASVLAFVDLTSRSEASANRADESVQPTNTATVRSQSAKSSSKKPSAQNKKTESVQIVGRVVDAAGKPVAGAQVLVRGSFRFRKSLRTGASGRFQFIVPRKTANYLGLIARSGDSLAYKRLLPDRGVGIVTTRKVILKLAPPRRISVTVRDAKKPVSGAWVAALADYRVVGEATTDAAGNAELRVPANVSLMNVFAVLPGVGLDYVSYRRKGAPSSNPYQLAQNHAQPLTLTLNGTRTVKVLVVNEKGKPMRGIPVYPWYFQKPKKGRDLNISGIERFHVVTGKNGVATFNFIPDDNVGKITFWPTAEKYFAPKRAMLDMQTGDSQVRVTLLPLVPVTGTVQFADGQPAKDITIRISGSGYSDNRFHSTTRPAADGTFKILLYPDQYYHFVAGGNEDFASRGVNVVVRRKPPKQKIQLVLQDAVRVFGRVTLGADRKPVAGQYIRLYLRDSQHHDMLPAEQRLPNPDNNRTSIVASIVRSTSTGKDGRFEFFVGPGKYYVIGPPSVKPPRFEIANQKSHEVNLHSALPSTGRITGRVVVKGKPKRGVGKATVMGVPVKFEMAYLKATTKTDGRFEAMRGLSEMFVHACSANGKLAGIMKIKATDKHVVILIGPTATATGRLIDQATGKPIVGAHLRYGHRITYTDKTFGLWFGGSVNTGPKGKFQLTGLVPGNLYELDVTEFGPKGQPRSSRTVHKWTPLTAKATALGDVKIDLR